MIPARDCKSDPVTAVGLHHHFREARSSTGKIDQHWLLAPRPDTFMVSRCNPSEEMVYSGHYMQFSSRESVFLMFRSSTGKLPPTE